MGISTYVTPVVVHGGIAYVSGQLPRRDGTLAHTGRVGAEVDVETARNAAGLCAQGCLDALANTPGVRLDRVLKLTGFVASAPDFTGQGAVIDGASEVMLHSLGDSGRHARSAIGVAALPHGASVEVELVAAVTVTDPDS